MSDAVVGDDSGVVDMVVPASLEGERVDRALSLLTGATRRRAADAVAAGAVAVDGAVVVTRSTPLRAGQRLQAELGPAPTDHPVPDSSVPFAVVHEDSDIIVVDKPAGVVVHHGAGHSGATLVDGLVARYPDLATLAGGEEHGVDAARPGIVHRLDKGTSGLVVVARSPAAFASLSRQMREHSAERRYLALVVGELSDQRGLVDAPIGRSARRPDRMAISAAGRPARTRFEVLRSLPHPQPVTLLEATLETGRTHQIRVHLNAIGHPVVGDDRYGAERARAAASAAGMAPGRVFLHAWRLTFEHPGGGRVTWEAPLPDDLEQALGYWP